MACVISARDMRNKPSPSRQPIERLRVLCLELPETFEKVSWKTPTFRVDRKKAKMFVICSEGKDGRPAFWCKAQDGAQGALVGDDPTRFFCPPYVGVNGWVGMWIDRRVSWNEVAGLVEDSYRLVAPKKLVARLGEGFGSSSMK
ncbi:MAG: MmcQ/YjbR family DNA-binding protein [bacterium]